MKSDLYERAARAIADGDARGAESLYREIIARYPADPSGYESLGSCLCLQARYDEATAEYKGALRLNDQSVSAHYGLGCIAYERRRYEEAKRHLERASSLDTGNGACHRVLGMVYDDAGDRLQAIHHYERAVALKRGIADGGQTQQRLNELKR